MRPLLVATLLASLGPAAPVPKAAKKDDAKLLVGRWKAADQDSQSFVFNEDGTMRKWGETAEESVPSYRWVIDPTATPKRLTLYDPKSTVPSFEGVYELDGEELRITYAAAPTVPPAVGRGKWNDNRMTREATK